MTANRTPLEAASADRDTWKAQCHDLAAENMRLRAIIARVEDLEVIARNHGGLIIEVAALREQLYGQSALISCVSHDDRPAYHQRNTNGPNTEEWFCCVCAGCDGTCQD